MIISEIVKKGIAVDTVILIILGVVVLGLIGYLLYVKFGEVGTGASLNDCRTIVITKYCPSVILHIADGYPGPSNSNTFQSFCQLNDDAKGCDAYQNQLGVNSKTTVETTCGIKFPTATQQ